MFRLFTAMILFLSFSTAYASPQCAANAEADKRSYAKAIERVEQLPEFKQWKKMQTYPIAFQAAVDKQSLISDACYWSVSVASNQPDRLAAWQTFYVAIASSDIKVEDMTGGEPMTLSDWRKQQARFGHNETLPAHVAAVADRSKSCQHFSGELNGDGSVRDKEIHQKMKSLKCNKIEKDVKNIRKRYAKNEKLLSAFQQALAMP